MTTVESIQEKGEKCKAGHTVYVQKEYVPYDNSQKRTQEQGEKCTGSHTVLIHREKEIVVW